MLRLELHAASLVLLSVHGDDAVPCHEKTNTAAAKCVTLTSNLHRMYIRSDLTPIRRRS